ncbi:Transferrin family [Macleaya cordata]|uniref:Transferrin family n=1 Tax=Macleaya cordata TaxID=56857 RepID=A0A200QI09_MACCD|nr:Transferrin family [Macleaya cordata]
MQIATVFSLYILLLSWVSLTIQGFGPAPAPDSGDGVDLSPKYETISDPPALSPASGISGERNPHYEMDRAPAPAPGKADKEAEMPGDFPAIPPPPPPPEDKDSSTVKWCAVRDEFVDCQYYLNLLGKTDSYNWKCVKRETTQECLDSIRNGEADLINLDAGLAYIAFLNYSMKAIANEVYCNHAESYDAVAIVNRKVCNHKVEISLMDFKGKRSCHGGYSTAMGWNYPVNHLKKLVSSKKLNDEEIVTGFFSEVCAPSEFEGFGVCSGCGNENSSCNSNSLYSGHSGAFRCLVEELGDIAFVKADTALVFSMEGPNNQTWSTKSIRDFMYLCPQGGCREINGYPGDCSFGTVPANVVMASNSISREKRLVVLQSLLNATWIDALYTGKNGAGHLLSSSAQGLAQVKKLTRSYLGKSASISQSIQELNTKKVEVSSAKVESGSGI